MVFRILFAAIITADNTKKAPKLAAIANAQLENANDIKIPPNKPEPKTNKATPKLAPEEIPKTKGPASGFLNSVCINNPQIESPDPTKTAVIAFGSLKFRMIVFQLSLEGMPPSKLLNISFKGIETEPKLIFINRKIISKTDKRVKCLVYDLVKFNYCNLVKKSINFLIAIPRWEILFFSSEVISENDF